MDGRSYTVDADVKIITSRGAANVGPKIIFDTRNGDRGLMSVTVSNSLRTPFQRCVLQFAPEAVTLDGRPWAEAIPPYSLVAVAIHRRSGDSQDPAATAAPVPVFLGVIDQLGADAEYGGGAPRRSNQLQARSLTSLLTDQPWFTHSWGGFYGADGQPVVSVPSEFKHFFPGITPSAFATERNLSFQGFLSFSQQLALMDQRIPALMMELVFAFFVGGSTRVLNKPLEAFIKVAFADNVPLAERLRFDAEHAKHNFVDPRAFIGSALEYSHLPNATCWDFFRRFSDPYLQELHSDTFGTSVDDAYVLVESRKCPFAGFIAYPGPSVGAAGGVPATYGQSCFDAKFGDWDREHETIRIDGLDKVSERLTRGPSRETYTLYRVSPALMANSGPSTSAVSPDALLPFIIDDIEDSPSRADVYGIRPLRYTTPYLSVIDTNNQQTAEAFTNQAIAYEALLWEWHHRSPAMWRGNLVCKGRTGFRVGKRLLDTLRNREYYIEDVRHQVTFGARTTFMSTLGVSRGWDLHD